MDVRKEAMVIAVLNGSGKQMMESIVETKASSLVQFMHGLRGELDVRERPPVTHEPTGSRPVARYSPAHALSRRESYFRLARHPTSIRDLRFTHQVSQAAFPVLILLAAACYLLPPIQNATALAW